MNDADYIKENIKYLTETMKVVAATFLLMASALTSQIPKISNKTGTQDIFLLVLGLALVSVLGVAVYLIHHKVNNLLENLKE